MGAFVSLAPLSSLWVCMSVCLSVLSRIYVCLFCLENMSVLSRICLSVLSRLCLSVLFYLESVSGCHILSVCLVLSRVCVYLVLSLEFVSLHQSVLSGRCSPGLICLPVCEL